MKKFFFTFLILSLIFLTAFIKNSTKRIDDEIYVIKENIRELEKDIEKIKLEYDYLSSTERLSEFNKLYFSNEFTKKDIKEIKIFYKKRNMIEIKQLRFFDE
tara:strand:+ start:950 stop:1255 length:306 start_codon:yes stop_codon:yes gene_type:complete